MKNFWELNNIIDSLFLLSFQLSENYEKFLNIIEVLDNIRYLIEYR